MLPIIMNIADQKIVLIGEGEAFDRRHAMIQKAGGHDILINPENIEEIPARSLVFIAGLPLEEARRKADQAAAAGAFVNTEDVPPLCDFHMPAQVRRGDVLFTVSTGGRSPALARLLRQDLEKKYGAEWSRHLDLLAAKRAQWRTQGMNPSEISQAAQEIVEKEKWLS